MLTSSARAVLKGLKKMTGNSDAPFTRLFSCKRFVLCYNTETAFDYSKYDKEIDSIMKRLEADGMIQSGEHHTYTLTQTAIHICQHRAWSSCNRFDPNSLIAVRNPHATS